MQTHFNQYTEADLSNQTALSKHVLLLHTQSNTPEKIHLTRHIRAELPKQTHLIRHFQAEALKQIHSKSYHQFG